MRSLYVFFLLVVVGSWGCAAGEGADAEPDAAFRTSPDEGPGDRGVVDGAVPGADGAPPIDAAPALDAEPVDAEPADAEVPDALPVDAAPPEPDGAPAMPCASEGARRACSPAERAACPDGVQICTGGAWSRCTGPDERCDGADNDCDGEVDEGIGLGEACMAGVGACARPGVGACDEQGGVVCLGQPGAPAPEQCDGVDNDCDGTTDEGFGLGQPCGGGVGACARVGTMVCDAEGAHVCSVEPGAPSPETCNGLDDDCDGRTDEGFAVGTGCTAGVGGCARSGRIACTEDGGAACNAAAGMPRDEICNAVDDDCDGEADEGFGVGAACVGEGGCDNEGVVICDGGGQAVCSVRAGAPEVCDGADNDCDGEVDEGFDVGAACTVGAGACQADGVVVCDALGRAQCDAEAPFVLDTGDGSDGELVVDGEVRLESGRAYQFEQVTVRAGGVLTLAPGAEGGGRLDLRVRGAFVVEAGGRVDLDGRGFAGGAANPKVIRDYPGIWTNGGGTTGYHGAGPGGGGGGWAAPQVTVGAGGGGGHGTPGGAGTPCGQDGRNYTVWDSNDGVPLPIAAPPARFSAGGEANGAADLPALEPGSGGGSGGNNYDGGDEGVGGAGGAGGAALRVVAGSIVIEGQITANGAPGQPGAGGQYVGGGGGGSGGSIHLVSPAVTLAGALRAQGGAGAAGTFESIGGAGGLGRIRVDAVVLERGGAVIPEPFLGELPCDR